MSLVAVIISDNRDEEIKVDKSIWIKDDINNQKAISDYMIKKAEKQLQVKLPDSYVNLLKIQNGGSIIYDAYPTDFPTSWADDHINVNELYGIGGETSILDSDYLIEEWNLPKRIVLISGNGHTWIALDYRETKECPPVILIDENGEGITEIAQSFELFLEGLTNWGEIDVELDGDDFANEREVKKRIAEQVREGRSNTQIKKDIERMVANGSAKQVDKLFEDILMLADAEMILYIIKHIIEYKDIKIRTNLASYLLACAHGMNKELDEQKIKAILKDMDQKEENKSIRYYIEAGLENLGI